MLQYHITFRYRC